MQKSYLLKDLNDKQREVVSAPYDLNLLVLAGAGSGKTRVLVNRIAWLITVEKFSPYSIIAVTFTNKAAIEMQQRVNQLLGVIKNKILIGTFHTLSSNLLRKHYMHVNLPKDFQILDSNDQYYLVSKLLNVLNLNEKQWSPQQCIWYINNKKNNGLRPKDIQIKNNKIEETLLKVYQFYQDTCDRSGLVDFSELLLRAYELFLNKTDILQYYCNRFTNIFVDEFQDTNFVQYAWIRQLVGKTGKLMIVGDDDQSIYGWRGAQIENIKRVIDDFSDIKTILLEQNYRSTKNILKAANALISNNSIRMGKKLWTKGIDGEPIVIYCASNELDESRYIIDQLKYWNENNNSLNNCAILYRRNSQSRLLEEALIKNGIPYCIYGGKKFFDRKEIKEVLSYLRLVVNRNDDASFERVINIPARGIGETTLDIIRNLSCKHKLTLWESCEYLLREKNYFKRASVVIQRFLNLINFLEKETKNMNLHVQVNYIIKKSGLFDMYKKEKNEKGEARIENLNEFLNAALEFKRQDESTSYLQSFLSYVSLNSSNEKKIIINQDNVQLMTLHSAKGLEFQFVFIIGVEEGILPSYMSIYKDQKIEEERRLAYVGITRAMKKLIITYTESRFLYGKRVNPLPSRFIGELPIECIKKIYLTSPINNEKKYLNFNSEVYKNDFEYKVGQLVVHDKFGEGKIINLIGIGKECKLQIVFQKQGVKWLVAQYARLNYLNNK
ncbi:DNA helicase II [Candidatus Providencia siddallii]|uniref:DNA 3'-5' helicase n=1 Tax=Candidatus Providencia siddallii TaxID=1715285 RepID=A0A0M6W8B8_9GAMM|nr:DNA helicase II [Candidatus Providencia siddallii]